jgi:ApaG protein
MSTAITSGIKISVKPSFRNDLSHVDEGKFFFQYEVYIENRNDFEVQLLEREWYIFDSMDYPKQVRGEGVVGEQPVLQAGEVFSYISGCELNSEIGYMKGNYFFKRMSDSSRFSVTIPKFQLEFPARMN